MQIEAVVVLYFPDEQRLKKLINTLYNQVSRMILVDNTPATTSRFFPPSVEDKIIYIALNGNNGIAGAQNIGVQRALDDAADYIIFFDQDSMPAADCVSRLYGVYISMEGRGFKTGGVGPQIIDELNGKKQSALINKGVKTGHAVTSVDQLISSGTLIRDSVFREVGLMEDGLFIDSVEFEWCWRALHKNYSFFVAEEARLYHKRGERIKKILGCPIHITTPFRKYYQYRNFLILFTRKYVPFYWKLSNLFKYIFKFFYYPIFISPRMEYGKRMLKGIWAGIYYWLTGKII